MKPINRQISNETSRKVWNQMAKVFHTWAAYNQVRDEVSDKVYTQVINQIKNQVSNKIDDQIKNKEILI